MNRDYKFCYVILHYQNKEITVQCTNMVLKLSDNSRIVIVDNASPNNSGQELCEEYKGNQRVHVIVSKKNEGFARGNNLGFIYAKNNCNPDYIVVMNSDVLIDQSDFESAISKFMSDNNVDVCGPDIVAPDGRHQNPLARAVLSDKQIRREIALGRFKNVVFKIDPLYQLHVKIRRMKLKAKAPVVAATHDEFDCVLHGSCVIYGKEYISNEEFAFVPITFMYGEEAILFDYLKHKSYKTGLSSEAYVYHLGGSSTQFDNDKSRYMFKLNQITHSYHKQMSFRLKNYDYAVIQDNI